MTIEEKEKQAVDTLRAALRKLYDDAKSANDRKTTTLAIEFLASLNFVAHYPLSRSALLPALLGYVEKIDAVDVYLAKAAPKSEKDWVLEILNDAVSRSFDRVAATLGVYEPSRKKALELIVFELRNDLSALAD